MIQNVVSFRFSKTYQCITSLVKNSVILQTSQSVSMYYYIYMANLAVSFCIQVSQRICVALSISY